MARKSRKMAPATVLALRMAQCIATGSGKPVTREIKDMAFRMVYDLIATYGSKAAAAKVEEAIKVLGKLRAAS